MRLADINIRDPFILPYNGKYYMYGTRAIYTWTQEIKDGYGFDVYESTDLENWSEPKSIFENHMGFWGDFQFWAPEVHIYKGRFYLLATFTSKECFRGTAILSSDTPNGEFKEHSWGALTPREWSCLDGTLYVENGTPYMVFCHEWCQIKDGEICAVELSRDLKQPQGQPFTLFKASDAKKWVLPVDKDCYVTDGPYMMNIDGELICLWSSFGKDGYLEAIARSSNGKMDGEWTVDDKLLFEKNGGHGMIFTDFSGNMNFVYHSPNETPFERPCVRKIDKNMLKRQ
ncbi:MAG: glycoside hydrolase [Ruminococcaceae bacterium]|nr:glycoside hydrolase [Oscillospiraceae bacterium]